MKTENRERNLQINFRVSEHEREFLTKKYKISKVKNFSTFLRKMAMEGYILNVDYKTFREMSAHIGKSAGVINQIGKRVNSTHNVYAEDMSEIKKRQEEIWRLLKSIQSKLP